MALPQQELYTLDDIYALPEGKRAELIDGQIYDMAPPNMRHQQISMELSATIHQYIKSKGGTCNVFAAPFAVFLNEDSKNYVEPDISVICDNNKLDDKGCNGAPDWVIEIVSASSKKMDYFVKLFKYRSAGVSEYWIVDPTKNLILAYHLASDDVMQYNFQDKVKVNIYDDFEIDFSQINI